MLNNCYEKSILGFQVNIEVIMEKTKLSTSVTVERYRELKDSKDKEAIADMIYERFSERYIEPFKDLEFKHGFSMMASACLMIESLYCFQRGRKNTG